jgi:hypothetical protein
VYGYRPRSEARTKVLIRSRLRGAGPERDACILDLSTRGLLATCAEPPQRGAFVELVANGYPLVGHVKWSNGRRFGMSLRERISVVALVANDGGAIRLEEMPAAQNLQHSAVAVLSAEAASVGRFTTFVMWTLAAVVAALLAGRSLQAAFAPLDKVDAAMASPP